MKNEIEILYLLSNEVNLTLRNFEYTKISNNILIIQRIPIKVNIENIQIIMNLKKILSAAVIAATTLSAMAIPAKRDIRVFRQSDGSQISVRLIGDEKFHSFVTTDGLPVERVSNGDFHYRLSTGVSDMTAHNPEMRQTSEESFIKAQGEKLSVGAIAKASSKAIEARSSKKVATRANSFTQVPNNGSPKIPVLLVQYKDKKFKDADPIATFNKFFVNGSTSAYQYFADQSNGKFTPEFDVYGPVTLMGNRATYGGNNAWGNDKALGMMVAESAIGLDGDIEYSRYDNDGDGECDVLIILYAGDGEASSMDSDYENAIWPCQWQLSSSDYGKELTLDNTRIDKFACFNELNGTNLRKIDGIGTFCHEFSHCLGLPDFYDTKYGPHFGMGPWSLMDYGSYNNDSYTPIGYSAYEKEFMGWIEIEEGKDNTLYTMPIFNSMNIDNDKAIRLTNPKDKKEYYILENRQQQGWDAYMPAEGLFIYHVTYNEGAWTGNTVNNFALQRMTPVPCDNNLKMDSQSYYGETYYSINQADLIGDLWPYKGNNEFTDNSSPAQSLNSGGYLGKPVTEITQNADGTVSFWLRKALNPALSTPVLKDHEIHSSTSATINWESGLETDATFNLEVKERSSNAVELVSSTKFNNMDVFGTAPYAWINAGYVAIEDIDGVKAARLGSSKANGVLTSPIFDGNSKGEVTVNVTSRQYNVDSTVITVILLDRNYEELDEVSVPVDAQFKVYSIKLIGLPNEKMFVRISSEASKKRIFVSQVDIYNGDATDAVNTQSEDLYSRLITGIEGTSYTLTDLKPGVMFDYRIKAIPRDVNSFSESDWSEKRSLDYTHFEASGVNVVEVDNSFVEYYTLQGLRIAKPTVPGIYIVKKGSKTYKKAF